ncbi:MAG: tyrosine-type recombinase/integrase [Planctomycetota bacterium]|jgi:integrase
MRAKLSARTIQTLSPGECPYEVVDTDLKGFLLRMQPSGAMTYYFSYRNGSGRRSRYRIGKHGALSPAQARDQAILLAARVVAGEDVQKEKKNAKHVARLAKNRTLEGFLTNMYEPWVCIQRKTGTATIKRIRGNFGHLYGRPLYEISLWAVEKWRSEQLKDGKAKTTINRDVTALKACLSKAVEWEILSEHPLQKLRPIKTENLTRTRYLSEAEEFELRSALDCREETVRESRRNANEWRRSRRIAELPEFHNDRFVDHLQPMVLIAMNTGLRRGELFHLRWADIDLIRKIAVVRAGNAKSCRTRHVPLNSEAVLTLRRWKKTATSSEWVFPSKAGSRLTSIKTSWHTVLRKAGITDFRWHDLRHHFASRLVMVGVDLNTVRELLGHSDLAMTLRYAHLSPEHKADAVARLCGPGRQYEVHRNQAAASR